MAIQPAGWIKHDELFFECEKFKARVDFFKPPPAITAGTLIIDYPSALPTTEATATAREDFIATLAVLRKLHTTPAMKIRRAHTYWELP